jgi:hypothetical protein
MPATARLPVFLIREITTWRMHNNFVVFYLLPSHQVRHVLFPCEEWAGIARPEITTMVVVIFFNLVPCWLTTGAPFLHFHSTDGQAFRQTDVGPFCAQVAIGRIRFTICLTPITDVHNHLSTLATFSLWLNWCEAATSCAMGTLDHLRHFELWNYNELLFFY